MINLYIFNESSRGAVYGIGTYIRELTSALKDSDINVCIVHLRSSKQEVEMEESEGIRYLHIPSPIVHNRSLDSNRQNEIYYRNVVYLLQLNIKDRKDLVFQLNYNHSSTLVEELKKSFICRTISVVHYSNWGFTVFDNLQRLRSALDKEEPNTFETNLKKSVEEERKIYSKMDRVVCLTNYMQEILYQDYGIDPAKISVIPNGLTDVAKKMSDVKLLRKKWNVSHSEKIILFAGRMDEIKGLVYLIKAFREILKIYPKCHLVFAGDGAYNIYIKESHDICTHTSYTGLLKQTDLYEWYRLADIGVTPSLFEPFGYVTVEMMMHGLPVVATDTSGLNEVVDDTCGLKVPLIEHPDRVEIDTTLLAQKILYLLQHSAEARKMGRNGRKRYLKEYSLKVFRKNMLEFYQSLYQSH